MTAGAIEAAAAGGLALLLKAAGYGRLLAPPQGHPQFDRTLPPAPAWENLLFGAGAPELALAAVRQAVTRRDTALVVLDLQQPGIVESLLGTRGSALLREVPSVRNLVAQADAAAAVAEPADDRADLVTG